jgi:molybdopterin/thiamine biosynthesis adenylyltransferase
VLSPDTVLRIPHVEEGGVLCIDGDPGPGSGLSAYHRIGHLLAAFREQFLEPWESGKLDDDFPKEPLNYWLIEVGRARSRKDPIRSIWTIDAHPEQTSVREGLLLLPGRFVIAAGNDLPITNRIVQSLDAHATQRIKVMIADIRIKHAFTPLTWPRNTVDLKRLLQGRLLKTQQNQFNLAAGRRGRKIHRIVLLRNETCGFAYLLPEGPPTVVGSGAGRRAYPSLTTPLPLLINRIDPSWTVGRDQHHEVSHRQRQHILVLGAGALGSPIVDHLAKAGIGFITLVDYDILETANLGRHLLGAESLSQFKVDEVAKRVNRGYPATAVTPKRMTAEQWLQENSLVNVDVVLDLTGEADVRWHVDNARKQYPCPLLIGWMEPYVAAAHVCSLQSDTLWMQGSNELKHVLEAVTWPPEVMRQEPGCSSKFQSYTAAAAAHAVALVAENALKLIDGEDQKSEIVSWVRGQRFLNKHWPGLELRDWAKKASQHDGMLIPRPFP